MMKLVTIFGVVFLMLASLSGVPNCLAQADQALKERAQSYWDAQVRQDWAVLYQYLTPYAQSQVGPEEFTASTKEKQPFRFLSFELVKTETAGDLGWVDLISTAQAAGFSFPPVKTETWEQWEKIDGTWYPIEPKRRAEAPSLPPSLRPALEEAALTKRADDFWTAKEKEQWDILYDFCDPEFRQTISKEEFLKKKAHYIYVTHSVEWAEVTGDRGKVRVAYLFRSSDPYLSKLQPVGETLVEDWIKKDGAWYRLMPKKEDSKEDSKGQQS
jgi:hypothetical protein